MTNEVTKIYMGGVAYLSMLPAPYKKQSRISSAKIITNQSDIKGVDLMKDLGYGAEFRNAGVYQYDIFQALSSYYESSNINYFISFNIRNTTVAISGENFIKAIKKLIISGNQADGKITYSEITEDYASTYPENSSARAFLTKTRIFIVTSMSAQPITSESYLCVQ